MDVRFIDTTFRDGSQSLWALGMRPGMMEAVAETMDRAGFDVIEVPGGNFMKKCVRDLKEDPWKMMRMLAKRMPNAVKSSMAGNYIMALDPLTPRSMIEFYYAHLVEIGALNRAQMTSNTFDQTTRAFPWIVPVFRKLGLQVVLALSYTISPRHSDEYYGQKTREIAAFKPDAIYLKDQGGLLTMDRARTLLPVLVENANGIPVELHSHCTTGLAPLVYLEALPLGVRRLHTGIPPLANGSGQPSIFNVAANARLMGYSPQVDLEVLRPVAERLSAIAKQEKLPIGVPLEYDYAQYIHQVPGGVISNLRHQLAELRILHRLDEVFEETVQVRKDFGYPIMITPYSQFVVTQAAINVATGERYRHVIDDMILFAKGAYGEDSGYTWMDQNLRDRLIGLRRAKELVAREQSEVSLQELRGKLGGPGVSDDEFLLRYIMKGEDEIRAMRAAVPKQYFFSDAPLVTLLRELRNHRQVRYIQVQRGNESLVLQNRSSA
jgi:oxaloacetate decarboxylase alpha subunit